MTDAHPCACLPLGDIVSAQTAAVLGLPDGVRQRAVPMACLSGHPRIVRMITRGLLCNGRMLCNGRCARRHRPTDRLLGWVCAYRGVRSTDCYVRPRDTGRRLGKSARCRKESSQPLPRHATRLPCRGILPCDPMQSMYGEKRSIEQRSLILAQPP